MAELLRAFSQLLQFRSKFSHSEERQNGKIKIVKKGLLGLVAKSPNPTLPILTMANVERNKAVTAVYLLLKKDNKVLIARRCNTGYQDGNYQVPAGHIDAGELPTQAMIREAKEEIGIELKREDLRLVHASFRPKHDETGDRVDYFFEATRWDGEIVNAEPEKCDDLRWVSSNELPKNMTPHCRVAIESAERGEMFSELSVEFLKSSGSYRLVE